MLHFSNQFSISVSVKIHYFTAEIKNCENGVNPIESFGARVSQKESYFCNLVIHFTNEFIDT